jgi:hypothetical protein
VRKRRETLDTSELYNLASFLVERVDKQERNVIVNMCAILSGFGSAEAARAAADQMYLQAARGSMSREVGRAIGDACDRAERVALSAMLAIASEAQPVEMSPVLWARAPLHPSAKDPTAASPPETADSSSQEEGQEEVPHGKPFVPPADGVPISPPARNWWGTSVEELVGDAEAAGPTPPAPPADLPATPAVYECGAGAEANPLQIVSVRFGTTKNLGNYQSSRLDAEALVSEGESPEGVLERLKTWVSSQQGDGPKVEDAESRLRSLRGESYSWHQKLEAIRESYSLGLSEFQKLRAKYDELKAILERHGIEVQDAIPEGPEVAPIPF